MATDAERKGVLDSLADALVDHGLSDPAAVAGFVAAAAPAVARATVQAKIDALRKEQAADDAAAAEARQKRQAAADELARQLA